MKSHLKLAALGGMLCASMAAHAIILHPIADTRILSFNPNGNYGLDTIFSVYNSDSSNNQHSLLMFDYSSLAGQTVTSATLELFGDSYLGTTSVTSTYVYRPTTSWTELGATWLNSSAGNPWTNPGGDFVGTTGVQESSPFATLTGPMTTSGALYNFDITTLVAGQVNGTWANNGILLTGAQGNALIFDSMNEVDPFFWPQLVVTTTTVPEPSSILGIVGLCGMLIARRRKFTAK